MEMCQSSWVSYGEAKIKEFETWASMFHPGEVLFWLSTQSWHHTLEREKWVSFHIWNWKSKIIMVGFSKFHSLTKAHESPKSTESWGFFLHRLLTFHLKYQSGCDLGGFTWKYCILSLSPLSLSLCLFFRFFSSLIHHFLFFLTYSMPLRLTLLLSTFSAAGQDNRCLIPAMRYKYVLPLNKQHRMTKDTSISITHMGQVTV